jgi:hypothetical protein
MRVLSRSIVSAVVRFVIIAAPASDAVPDFFLLAFPLVLADAAFFLTAIPPVLSLIRPSPFLTTLLPLFSGGEQQRLRTPVTRGHGFDRKLQTDSDQDGYREILHVSVPYL